MLKDPLKMVMTINLKKAKHLFLNHDSYKCHPYKEQDQYVDDFIVDDHIMSNITV